MKSIFQHGRGKNECSITWYKEIVFTLVGFHNHTTIMFLKSLYLLVTHYGIYSCNDIISGICFRIPNTMKFKNRQVIAETGK